MITLPLTPDSDYEVAYDIEEETVSFRVRWNGNEQAWYVDLTGITFTLDLKGQKLVGGVNILKPHAVTELGGLFMVDVESTLQDPDFDLVGDKYKLIYVTKAELSALTV